MRKREAYSLDNVVTRAEFGRGFASSDFVAPRARRALAEIDREPTSYFRLVLLVFAHAVLVAVASVGVFFANGWGWDVLAAIAVAGLGVLLLLRGRERLAADPTRRFRDLNIEVYAMTPTISPRLLRGLPPERRTPSDLVLDRPQSDYGAALRRLGERAIAAADGAVPIIAITAPHIADGGAVEALSLARTLASQGLSVVAIDCDSRLAGLTELAGIRPRRGIWEVLDDRVSLREVIVGDPRSSVRIIGIADGRNDLRDLFGNPKFAEALGELRAKFDVVILSCPPTLNAAVTPVITRNSTLCVLVARWSRTSRASLRAAMRALRLLHGPKPGVLLTETPSFLF